jgi:hypothetical protein
MYFPHLDTLMFKDYLSTDRTQLATVGRLALVKWGLNGFERGLKMAYINLRLNFYFVDCRMHRKPKSVEIIKGMNVDS